MTYKIMWKSKYGTEQVDEAETEAEANYMVMEYRMAYGEGILWKVKQ